MLKRLDLVGNIAAEEVSPKKMGRGATSISSPSLSATSVAAAVEIEEKMMSQTADVTSDKGYAARHSQQKQANRGGKFGRSARSDLRKRYGVL